MSTGDLVWGLALIGGGVFIGVYGELLFRFVLAMIGFLVGFTALYLILDGQTQGLQILLSLAAGGIGALLLYTLFNFGLYVAGGALGAVAGLIVASLIGLNSGENSWLLTVLVLAGTGGAGFFRAQTRHHDHSIGYLRSCCVHGGLRICGPVPVDVRH